MGSIPLAFFSILNSPFRPSAFIVPPVPPTRVIAFLPPMQREEKSERSRRQVLDAALHLFSHQGFRATSVREVADRAGVSIGNVYHHFPDKEAIFQALLNELWDGVMSKRFPFRRALSRGHFPDNLEDLGWAARDSVAEYKPYLALIYVDVIEFEGTHIRRFYSDLAQRFRDIVQEEGLEEAMRLRLRNGITPADALMITWRIFFNYFSMELVFNVPSPLGKDTSDVVCLLSDILRNGFASQE